VSSNDFDQQVWQAEQVRCVRCYADPGVPCANTLTGEALRAAHWQRVRDSDAPRPPLRAVPDGPQPHTEPHRSGSDAPCDTETGREPPSRQTRRQSERSRWPQRFRKRPIEIEAIQLNSPNAATSTTPNNRRL